MNESPLTHSDEELTPPEAAAYLGVSPEEFTRLVKRFGIGRHYQAEEGEQWVYEKSDLDHLRESQTEEQAEMRRAS